MLVRRIHILYFSPTGGTRRVARAFLAGLRGKHACELEEFDLTMPEARRPRTYGPGDLVFLFTPVFFGRVVETMQDVKLLSGTGAVGVPVVVYGNRHYDDAMRELADIMRAQGFTVAGAGAFIAEHSQNRELGRGRPDTNDRAEAGRFAEAVLRKVLAAEEASTLPVTVPGESDYKPYGAVKAVPVVAHPERCQQCGDCAEKCPVGIIDPLSFAVTDPASCIGCRACTAACPDGARDLPEPGRTMIAEFMAKLLATQGAPKPNLILL